MNVPWRDLTFLLSFFVYTAASDHVSLFVRFLQLLEELADFLRVWSLPTLVVIKVEVC